MKKCFFFVVCFVLAIILLYSPAVAISAYTDDMSSANSDDVKVYRQLAPLSIPAGQAQLAGAFPDKTSLVLAGGGVTGVVEYKIQGAQKISLAIYHRSGTFVNEHPEQPGVYMCGAVSTGLGYLNAHQLSQALYSRSLGAVFAKIGGEYLRMEMDADYCCRFVKNSGAVPLASELIPYGVDVLVSTDGINFDRRIALSYTNILHTPAAVYRYEEFSGTIPPNVVAIRVQLNDISRISAVGGAIYPLNNFTAIASVAFTGSSLVCGTPAQTSSSSSDSANASSGESISSHPESESSPSVPAESSSGEGASSGLNAAIPAEEYSYAAKPVTGGAAVKQGRSASASERSASSHKSNSAASASLASSAKAPTSQSEPAAKFEGVITSSAKGSSSSKKTHSIAEEETVLAAFAAQAEETQADIYEIERSDLAADSRFGLWITLYILAVCGVTLFLLLRPKGAKTNAPRQE